jgi:hypothetical protein
MKNSTLQNLQQFVVDYAHCLSASESTGDTPSLPRFELYASDYLEFAEEELEQYQVAGSNSVGEKHLINCISHLKRAMDCGVDTFMGTFGLLSTFRKRNLKFGKKLEFLREAGIFSSRTLARLNTIRNKMEHEYQMPQSEAIEVYFDLVSAFVAVLERTIPFSQYWRIEFWDPEETGSDAWIAIRYDYDRPSIAVQWGTGREQQGQVSSELDEPKEFAFLLKVFILLLQSERFVSSRYVVRKLGG